MADKDMSQSEQVILYSDLQRANSCLTFSKEGKQDEALLKGTIHRNVFTQGLSIHAGDAIERVDRSSFAELPSAISFNIIFTGQVTFSLSHRQYTLTESSDGVAACSAFILNRNEILCRQLKRGNHVRKLNIFVQRDWLEDRASTNAHKQLIDRLFANHGLLHSWQPSRTVSDWGEQLFSLCLAEQHTYRRALQEEALTIMLLGACIDELVMCCDHQIITHDDQSPIRCYDKHLKHRVDVALLRFDCLHDIANAIGMSVSTMQRQFKSAYGITVSRYCRQRKLEMAKVALMIDKKSIGEAAYIAGYNHASNFITAFKKHYGLTPKEWINHL